MKTRIERVKRQLDALLHDTEFIDELVRDGQEQALLRNAVVILSRAANRAVDDDDAIE